MKTLLAMLIIIFPLMTSCSGPVATPNPPANAESSYSCDVRQGFNFEKDSQTMVGFINYLKIGDREMKSDMTVTNPEDVTDTLKVFGVVSSIYWRGGYLDPIEFSSQVSVDNKNSIATLLHKTMSNTEIEFSFTIYDYDPKQKKYYQCFHSNGVTLKGLVRKHGGELAMALDMDQSMEIVSPKNYRFSLGVMPQDLQQEIHLAVSVSDKFVKPYGVTIE